MVDKFTGGAGSFFFVFISDAQFLCVHRREMERWHQLFTGAGWIVASRDSEGDGGEAFIEQWKYHGSFLKI